MSERSTDPEMNRALFEDAAKLEALGQHPGPTLDDFDDDDGGDECWDCGGEGFYHSCLEVYACVDPEGGCDECERTCSTCRGTGHLRQTPAAPNQEMAAILADALAAAKAPQ